MRAQAGGQPFGVSMMTLNRRRFAAQLVSWARYHCMVRETVVVLGTVWQPLEGDTV